jgi:HEAT repeat protein
METGVKVSKDILDKLRFRATIPVCLSILEEDDIELRSWALTKLFSYTDNRVASKIIEDFHLFEKQLQAIVKRNADHVFEYLKDFYKKNELQTRLNILEILRYSKRLHESNLITLSLIEANPTLRIKALETLKYLQEKYQSYLKELGHLQTSPSIEEVQFTKRMLSAPIVDALNQLSAHRQFEVVDLVLGLDDSHRHRLIDIIRRPSDPRCNDVRQYLQKNTNKRVADLIFNLLVDASEDMRREGIELMMMNRNEAVAERLLFIILDKSIPEILKITNRYETLPCFDPQVFHAFDPEIQVKILTLSWIGSFGEPLKIGMYLEGLQSPYERIRMRGIVYLGEIGTKESIQAISDLIRDPSENIRLCVLNEIIEARIPDKLQYYEYLKKDPSPRVKSRALSALFQEHLINYLARCDDMTEQDKKDAGQKMFDSTPEMISQIYDEIYTLDGQNRFRVLDLLKNRGGSMLSLDRLADLLNDKDHRVRSLAVMILGSIDDKRSTKLLMDTLKDADHRVRANVVEILGHFNSPDLDTILLPYLDDTNNRIRGNAAHALYTRHLDACRRAIKTMLTSGDQTMRLTAIWVLKQVKDIFFSNHLKLIVEKETNYELKTKAQDALKSILRG